VAGLLAGLVGFLSGELLSAALGFGLAGLTFGLPANALIRQ
jgi:hypothetical protein